MKVSIQLFVGINALCEDGVTYSKPAIIELEGEAKFQALEKGYKITGKDPNNITGVALWNKETGIYYRCDVK